MVPNIWQLFFEDMADQSDFNLVQKLRLPQFKIVYRYGMDCMEPWYIFHMGFHAYIQYTFFQGFWGSIHSLDVFELIWNTPPDFREHWILSQTTESLRHWTIGPFSCYETPQRKPWDM